MLVHREHRLRLHLSAERPKSGRCCGQLEGAPRTSIRLIRLIETYTSLVHLYNIAEYETHVLAIHQEFSPNGFWHMYMYQ